MKKALVFFVLIAACIFTSCNLMDLFKPTGTLEGWVIDATTGLGLEDVLVFDTNNDSFSTYSDSDGFYSFDLPSGDRTIGFSIDDYIFSDIAVTVIADDTVWVSENETIGNPVLTGEGLRFILTWGDIPYDLDSYLETPSAEIVSYYDPVAVGANLDHDDTSSFGPETITITDQASGIYKYYVNQYSSDGSLSTSSAVVKIYNASGLLKTYNVPASGTGEYWNVCTINGSTITAVNRIQSTQP